MHLWDVFCWKLFGSEPIGSLPEFRLRCLRVCFYRFVLLVSRSEANYYAFYTLIALIIIQFHDSNAIFIPSLQIQVRNKGVFIFSKILWMKRIESIQINDFKQI
ncbi:hypothetical protein T07_1220 [Trichinella nelsoni]|uniref:Uncharacterized protein n=1 Tax=Trichinella nelsoni TaxID=6336 RepID=A0A0V0SLZ6_9BILA|nr:hypothetical protein T07_1220 [Trichinella nelsoni]